MRIVYSTLHNIRTLIPIAQEAMLNRGTSGGGGSARFGRPDESRSGYSGDQDVDMKESHTPSRLAQPRSYAHSGQQQTMPPPPPSSAG